MAEELLLDVVLNTDKANTSLSQMKKDLREAQGLLTNLEPNTEAFAAAAKKAAELKDRIEESKEAVNSYRSDGIEGITASYSRLGDKISNLDFEGVGKDLGFMATSIKSIKISEFTSGLGDMAKGFAKLGAALLTNPIFLIATAIAAIATATYFLVDAINDDIEAQENINAARKEATAIDEEYKQKLNDLKDAQEELALANDVAAGRITQSTADITKARKASAAENEKILADEVAALIKAQTARDEALGRIKTTKAETTAQGEMIMVVKSDEELAAERLVILQGYESDRKAIQAKSDTLKVEEAKVLAAKITGIEEEEARKKKAAQDKAIAEYKKYLDTLASYTKKHRDAHTALLDDSMAKDLEIQTNAYNDELAAINKLEVTKADKERLRAEALEINLAKQQDIRDKWSKIQLDADEKALTDELALKKTYMDENIADSKAQATLELAQTDILLANDKLTADERNRLEVKKLDTKREALDAEKAMKEAANAYDYNAEVKYNTDIANLAAEEAALKIKYDDEVAANHQKRMDERYSSYAAVAGSMKSIGQDLGDFLENVAASNESKNKKRQKAMFNVNKGLAATETSINTLQAIMKITAQGGIWALPLSIATGIQGAAAVLSILSKKFPDNGQANSDSSIPKTSLGDSGASASAFSPNNKALFSTGGGTPTALTPFSQGINGNQTTTKVVVLESDITKTQNSVNKVEVLSTI